MEDIDVKEIRLETKQANEKVKKRSKNLNSKKNQSRSKECDFPIIMTFRI